MGALTGGDPAADTKEEVRREQRRFRDEVAAKGARLRRFRRRGDKGFWSGVASFGMVGWSIAVPMLLGIAIGSWLDRRSGGGIRYTLSLMVLGLGIGANNAWRWIKLQEEEVEEEEGAEQEGAGAGGAGSGGEGPPEDPGPPGAEGGAR